MSLLKLYQFFPQRVAKVASDVLCLKKMRSRPALLEVVCGTWMTIATIWTVDVGREEELFFAVA